MATTSEPLVTRVEVIDSTGRAFVGHFEPGVQIDLQDEGRTVKIFAGASVPVSTVYSKG
jgi:hypothetical protein